MLMAAGEGVRLRPFTGFVPKPFLPVFGVPVFEYLLNNLYNNGIIDVVMNTHHLSDVAAGFIRRYESLNNTKIQISDERVKLLGSAGGIRHALEKICKNNSSFLLSNADIIYNLDIKQLVDKHAALRKKHNVLVTLAVLESAQTDDEYSEIMFDKKTDMLTGVGKKRINKPMYSGVAVLEKEAVAHLHDNEILEFVPSVLFPAIKQNRAGVLLFKNSLLNWWVDIGTPKLWHGAHMRFLQALKNNNLPEGFRKIIEKVNEEVAPGVWKKKGEKIFDQTITPPSYWGAGGNCPGVFGPNSVLYGRPENLKNLENGIGFGGAWVSINN